MSKFFQKYGLLIFYAFCIVALIIVIGNAIKEKLIVPPGASKDLVVNESLEKAKEEAMTTEEEENAMRSQIEENKAETQKEEPTNNEENTQTEETNNNSNEKINDKTEESKTEEIKKEENNSNTKTNKTEPTNNQTSNEKIYKIVLDSQGGTIYLKYNNNYSLDSNGVKSVNTISLPKKTGYLFNGYYTKANGKGTMVIDKNGSITSDKTLFKSNSTIYAYWVPLKYTISFNCDGGENVPSSQIATSGASFTLTSNTCKKTGYTQNGWLDPSGSIFKSGWSTSKWTYVNGDRGISNNKLELKANWVTTSKCSNTSKIHFINVGDADSMLIESNCHYGLVDSGNPYNDGTPQAMSNSSYTGIHVKNYLNSLGVKHLDFIIATHSHSDHIGGMRHIINAGLVNSSTAYYYRKYETNRDDKIHGASSSDNWDNSGYHKRVVSAMPKAGVKMVEVTNISKSFSLGDFNIKLLNTESFSKEGKNPADYGENENAIVELVTYKGKYKALLGADVVKSDEEKLVNNKIIPNVDIFKLGHHGLYTSTGYTFVDALKPKIAIISSSSSDRWNVASIYYMMNKYNTKVYQTARTKDAIVATFTSTGYTVKAEENKSISPISLSTVKTDGKWKKMATYKLNGSLNTSYWYYIENNTPALGWKKIVYNGKENSYYFIKSAANAGRMATGWVEISNKWYYFDSDGAMAKGWRNLTYKGQKSWFYLKSNGVMAESETLTINGSTFKFNSNGVCISGKGC